MRFKTNETTLEVYAEIRTRRMLVGILRKEGDSFEFSYEKKYLMSPNAISIGPDLPLSKKNHTCKGKLFPSFQDRIPSKINAAYAEYCLAAGISPREKNPIILLGAIGKRGPSAFVFEPIVTDTTDGRAELDMFRQEYKISLHEISRALGLNEITLQRIAAKKSTDLGTMTLLKIYLTVPKALENQLKITGRRIHRDTVSALQAFSKGREIESTELTRSKS